MKFHIVHPESDSHYEEEFDSYDDAYEAYKEVDVYIVEPKECPACKRGEPLE